MRQILENINVTTFDEHLFNEEDSNEVTSKPVDMYLLIRYSTFIFSVVSDVLILHSRFKIETFGNPNIKLIVNWAIINLFYFVYQMLIIDLLCISILKYETTPTCLRALSGTAFLLNYIFGLGMLIRSILINSKYTLSEELKDIFDKYFMYFLYSIGIMIWAHEYFYIKYNSYELVLICLDSVIICALIINIIRCIFKIKFEDTFVVYVGNCIIISLIPLVIFHYLFFSLVSYGSVEILDLLFLLRIIPEIIMFSNPIIVCIILYKTSRYFNKAFKSIFISCKQPSDIKCFNEVESIRYDEL